MRKALLILYFIPFLLNAQEFSSCPHEMHTSLTYENPLYEKWLSHYDVGFYHINLEVSNLNTFIDGFAAIKLKITGDVDSLVFQLIDVLEVKGVEVNGKPVSEFTHYEDALYIANNLAVGEIASVKIHYSGNAGQDRGFFAGITSAWDITNQQQVLYTLSEPLNARDWFPVKQVLDDKADSVWIDITVASSLMAGSNGRLESIEDNGDGKHTFKWRSNYPIAYYLISMAVADYRDYSFYADLSGENDSVLVQNFIYDDDTYYSNWKDQIDETAELITLFSKLVLDYPFAEEKYGHAVAPMGGGMEHQTMTTLVNFNFKLVAHELAHQWFGDYITCGNWQDIWINEGFASYCEYIALQNLRSQLAADDWMEYAMSLAISETGSVYVPESEAENVGRIFDYGLSYKKGAVLLHMIRYEINNDDLFFEMLRTYVNTYANSNATAVHFREVLDEVSGMDFSCFFDQWYYGTGYPHFDITYYRQNDTLYIESTQQTTSTATPLFKTHFDIRMKTIQGEETIRLFQDENNKLFKIPKPGVVTELTFDPDKHLLATSQIENVSVQNSSEETAFRVYPNPSGNSVVLEFSPGTGAKLLHLYSLEGKLVLKEEIERERHELDLHSLKNATYLLMVKVGSNTYLERIVKASQE
ncbi:M1 family aminopeptidase [Bacteroidota bacterium]